MRVQITEKNNSYTFFPLRNCRLSANAAAFTLRIWNLEWLDFGFEHIFQYACFKLETYYQRNLHVFL